MTGQNPSVNCGIIPKTRWGPKKCTSSSLLFHTFKFYNVCDNLAVMEFTIVLDLNAFISVRLRNKRRYFTMMKSYVDLDCSIGHCYVFFQCPYYGRNVYKNRSQHVFIYYSD